jgi:hypothetical protein
MAIVVVVAPRGAPASIRLREAPSPCLLGNTNELHLSVYAVRIREW